jgi:protein-S-isoprenylcysteine O-methyltransferase Ste14
MSTSPITPSMWAQTVFTTLLVPALVMGLGGDARWVEGWIFCAWYVFGCAYVVAWLYHNNLDLLVERFRKPGSGGQSSRDKIILGVMFVGFFAWVVLMPLDARRFHWTRWPWPVSLAGAAMLVGASRFLFRAFVDNTFLSPLVRIQAERGQRVVDTGVYALVRHPMYLGATLLFLGAPVALRSGYGLVVGAAIVALTIVRIFEEERVLERDLPGYAAYEQKVRWRLVPGVF